MSEFGGEVAGGGQAAGDEFIPGPRVKVGPQQWTFYGTTLPNPWITAGTGRVLFPNQQNGGVNLRVLIAGETFIFLKPGRKDVAMVREIRMTVVTSWTGGGNLWFGFANSALATVNDFDNNATQFVAMRQLVGINAKLKSGDGTTRSESDSGIASDTLNHVWEILVRASDVQLIRDGVVILTKTTNLPASATLMEFFIQPIDNAGDSTAIIKEIWIEFKTHPVI